MIELTQEQWDHLFDEVDNTVQKAINDLPPESQPRADEVGCVVDKYPATGPGDRWEGMKVLGCYAHWTNGPIMIFVGQIFEDCNQDVEATMKSVRQVYYHELAHAMGHLAEYEVKELGL